MKTAYNSLYTNQYDVLFQEAVDALLQAEKDGLTDLYGIRPLDKDEDGTILETFSNIESYFARIGDLAKLHSHWVIDNPGTSNYDKYSKFLMLPMDEVFGDGLFVIDANARTIKVPSSFTKNGVSITGDEMAETLLFEIDRFFDVTDLVTTDIFVQWTNPAGQEGASKITMVDYSTKPGKIVFGWPLTSKVTVEGSGKLQFSVRFFKKNNEGIITYSLNTIPVTVSIKQALHTDINEGLVVDDPAALFATVIENGPISGAPEAAMPQFESNLVSVADLVDNELQLSVNMLTFDSGTLTYKLMYTPTYIDNNTTVLTDTQELMPEVKFLLTEDAVVKANKRYYLDAGEGKFTIAAVTVGDAIEAADGLYEAHAVYTVKWDADADFPHVTGTYTMKVTNSVFRGNPVTISSNVLTIPTVDSETMKFDTNLEENKMLAAADVGETLSVVASALTKKSGNAEPAACDMTYQWAVSMDGNVEEPTFVNAGEVTASGDYENATPGWYRATAYATRNNEVVSADSVVCRVVNPIAAPEIDPPMSEIPVTRNADGGDIVKFEVTLLSEYDALTSDGVQYHWYRNRPDDNAVALSIEDADVASMNDGVIEIIVPANADTLYYYCNVVNTLAGQEATTQSNIFVIV